MFINPINSSGNKAIHWLAGVIELIGIVCMNTEYNKAVCYLSISDLIKYFNL